MISIIEISPTWFYNYNIILEMFFAVISGLISWFGAKAYRITKKNEAKILSRAFLFISLSYLLEGVFSWLSIREILNKSSQIPWSYLLLRTTAIYSHKLFMLLGLIALFIFTIKEKRKEVFIILTAISILTISFQNSCWMSFFLLNTIFLLFISQYYLKNYMRRKNLASLLTSCAFILMTLANITLAISIENPILYVPSQCLNLGAYTALLTNLYIILKARK